MLRAKSWSLKSNPVLHPRVDKRQALTVYGAIGSCLIEPVYMIGKSTNKEKYQKFIAKLAD